MIVGAGLGGLATALRLAHRGASVLVLEKTDQVGGRDRSLTVGECRFDAGPTLTMMLDPFRRLFADVGEDIDDHLDLRLCDPSYRVFYADGSRIEGSPNAARMIAQIEALAGTHDALAYPQLLGRLAALYKDAIPHFVRKQFRSPLELLKPRAIQRVLRHRMLGNLAQRIDRTFDDPRLRMLFSFQTMYLGLSPYDAPWVYAVLTYMEYGEGIWYPMGGMTEIPRTIADLAARRGVEIRLDSEVVAIDGRVVRLASGESVTARTIVCNADLPYAEQCLLNQRPKPRTHSCSAYMMYMDVEGHYPELLHHNVVFGADYRRNLDDIFHRHMLPEDPSFYVCVSSRTDPDRAGNGRENLYVLVPVPNLTHPWSPADADAIEKTVLTRLSRDVGFDPAAIRAKKTFSPRDWADTLHLDLGAAFGLAHTTFQSACFRPPNRSRTNQDVYFVGASTTPGNGLPMVLISAELLEARLAGEGRL